jgi:hypothetical protein
MFFSEEKNQKTFIPPLAANSRPWPPNGALLRRKSPLPRAGRASAFSSKKTALLTS